MWTAATSGTSNASQHHIQEGMRLSKVTLKFVDPFEVTSFVLNGAGPLERNGLIGNVASFLMTAYLNFKFHDGRKIPRCQFVVCLRNFNGISTWQASPWQLVSFVDSESAPCACVCVCVCV